ncbi:MAG: DNA-binding transcriptional repressor AcrR [Methanoregula sp. PtaU1.Bin006]|jgi:AcrR family transcriptional regulator|uniref:TetR/AcrR family transcriptional regulator n=1 Tax=Methanoregula sp. PtaU1.Bin006 TaxID=1811681 RepID=UPI0009CC8480|nr:TetR/AcrR family transcriptional regulator [Methanoregula sp. PtaU1.Bin006]OPY35667.1 MAG: DNA-binding transcriptional repressor AcrR [Methanoregula sp. PtaU1.Bin006]
MSRINTEYHIEYREDAKKKIIAAALDVAAEHGWDAVTLDAIAQNIGVTKPALYSYFKNREALLRDVTLEVVRNIQTGLETTLVHDNDIHRIIRNLAKLLFEQQKPYANIFFQLPTRMRQDAKNHEEFAHFFDKSRIVIRDSLTRIKSDEGLLREVDPDAAAYMIIAMTMGLLTSSDFLEMDVNVAKKIWIDTVERYLLIGHRAGDRQ